MDLMGLGKAKKLDSTFVKDCLRFLYKNDLNALKHITVKKAVDGKTVMPTEKREMIAAALRFRLSRFKDDFSALELHERSKDAKIDEHIQNGLQNTIKMLNKCEKVDQNTTRSGLTENATVHEAQSSFHFVSCYVDETGYVVEEENDLVIEDN